MHGDLWARSETAKCVLHEWITRIAIIIIIISFIVYVGFIHCMSFFCLFSCFFVVLFVNHTSALFIESHKVAR